jgi:hypothetical protein
MGAVYKNYKAGNVQNAQPGYTPNAFLLPVDWIDTFADVVGNAAAGDRVTIDDSHVALTGKGAIAVYCAPKTVSGDGDMVGETLAKRFQWKPKVVIPGDTAALLDMNLGLINKSFLLFVEDAANCANGVTQYIQFGCECDPCLVNAGSFKSGTVAEGRKQTEFEMEAYCKFFYNGTLTVLADSDEVIE